jgi:hypothetical protein
MDINTSRGQKNMIKVNCTDTGKTIDAELLKVEKDRLTVILPGFQKLVLNRSSKPGLFVANQFGMEFTARTL